MASSLNRDGPPHVGHRALFLLTFNTNQQDFHSTFFVRGPVLKCSTRIIPLNTTARDKDDCDACLTDGETKAESG